MLIAVLDFGTREMRFEGPMMPGEDIGADMAEIVSHYREVEGKHPEKFVLPD